MWSFATPSVAALVLALLPAAAASTAASEGTEAARTTMQTGVIDATVAGLVPTGFNDTVVESVDAPTALAWTPDGRLLVTSKPGRVIVRHEDGTRRTALDISARVCAAIEQGLVGVAVDPAFAANHFVYVYYTHRVRGSCGGTGPKPANRVSRFVLGDDDTMALSSEVTLADHIPSPVGNHIAGDLEFGTDDYLYVTVGDGVCSVIHPSLCGPTNDNAQRRNIPLGKVLRITRNGLPAPENPYFNAAGARWCTRPSGVPSGTGPCKEILAIGFRNPFRFDRKPGSNLFYVNDVGMDTWEEVDRLLRGANYGWNVREGHCRRDSTTDCGVVPGFTNPIHDYRHADNCRSITGAAFVPTGVWPGWDDAYLYADFACGKIFRLQPNSDGGFQSSLFASGLASPVDLRFGPDRGETSLYYLSFTTDTVHRIAQSSVNAAPVADFTYRPDGLSLSFSGAASYDPDSDGIMSWSWDFGDGTSAVTTTPTTDHTYAEAGPFDVGLTVTDSRGLSSAPVTKNVWSGEHPPSLIITQPAQEARFAVGANVPLAAEATDAEDGPLPGTAISWTLRLRHANHFHPYLGPVSGGSVTTTYPAPENLTAALSSHLVATATAVDSHGIQTTVERVLWPRTVDLTFRTRPAGGRVRIQGVLRRTSVTVKSWVHYVFPVGAPDQRIDGVPMVFRSWSDGKPRRHNIVSPATPTTYVARFRRR